MSWLLPAIGVPAVGVAAWGLWSILRPKHALVMYVDDPQYPDNGTFSSVARMVGRYLNTTPVPIRSGQDILDAIRQAPSNLGVVVMVGHGTTAKFFSPARFGVRDSQVGGDALPAWITDDTFAAALAPKLARGFILSIAGCSSAAQRGEPTDWTFGSSAWDGGAGGLAGQIRDSLSRRWASGEIRGHTLLGTTLDNPQGRTFYAGLWRTGQPGVHVMHQAGWSRPQDFADYRAWNNYFRGRLARGWMVGLPVPRGRTRGEIAVEPGGGKG